jgi:hypothetical protein
MNAATPRRLRRHPSARGEFAGAWVMVSGVGFGGCDFFRASDSPSVKGWTRSGRGSSALMGNRHKISKFKLQVNSNFQLQNSKLTLQHPVAPRHPSTRGESADAGEFGMGGNLLTRGAGAMRVGFRGRVNNSPLVEGWRRSRRGVAAFHRMNSSPREFWTGLTGWTGFSRICFTFQKNILYILSKKFSPARGVFTALVDGDGGRGVSMVVWGSI